MFCLTNFLLVLRICINTAMIFMTKGGGLLGILKKNIFIFNTLQKMVTKLGQFTKLKCQEGSRKIYPNFVTIFCKVLKIKMIFLNIPSNPPPFVSVNSLTNQINQKN